MFLVVATVFPCLVALTWGMMSFFMKGKNGAQKLLALLLFMAAAYLYVDSYFINPSLTMDDYRHMVWLDVIAQYLVYALPVIACFYVRSLEKGSPLHPATYLFFLPGVIQSTAVLVLAVVVGTGDAAKFYMDYDAAGGFPAAYADDRLLRTYSWFTKDLYRYLLLLEFFVAAAYLLGSSFFRGYRVGDAFRFFFKGKVSKLSNLSSLLILLFFLLCIVRAALSRLFFLEYPAVTAIISLLFAAMIFLLGHSGFFLSEKGFTKHDIAFSRRLVVPGPAPETNDDSATDQQTETVLLTDEFPADAVLPSADEPIQGKKDPAEMEKTVQSLPPQQRLFFNFSMYMVEERPYLNPELTIIDVATALHSNRTYISALVAERYGMPFRDYINTQRINFAKTYILTHPDAILEEVAAASGFASASQFVKKFHQIENVSPRIWQANPDLSHNKVE